MPQAGPSTAELSNKLHEMSVKALDNEKRIQELEKTVNDKSQWNNTVRGWVGQKVLVRLQDGVEVRGELKSLDRYTLYVLGSAFDGENYVSSTKAGEAVEIIVHKGSIGFICKDG
jgi:small nuclear ribonucleoprotein (snRNP)-like protein